MFILTATKGAQNADMEPTLTRPAQEALQRHFVGQQVRIPRDPSRLLRRVETLTAAEAKSICEEFGGARIYGRKLTRRLAEARNDRIWARRKHGATLEELAFEFDLSSRQVSNILRSYPK